MLPEFLNVDLEIESRVPLDLLVREFGDKVHVLYNGPIQDVPYLLAIEIYEGDDQDPNSIIDAFCDLLEDLSPKARALWKKASLRCFDIGIESGTGQHKKFSALCLSLRPETLKRITALSAEILITVYPPRPQVAEKSKSKAKKK